MKTCIYCGERIVYDAAFAVAGAWVTLRDGEWFCMAAKREDPEGLGEHATQLEES